MKHYLFDAEDYGFVEINELKNARDADKILSLGNFEKCGLIQPK